MTLYFPSAIAVLADMFMQSIVYSHGHAQCQSPSTPRPQSEIEINTQLMTMFTSWWVSAGKKPHNIISDGNTTDLQRKWTDTQL